MNNNERMKSELTSNKTIEPFYMEEEELYKVRCLIIWMFEMNQNLNRRNSTFFLSVNILYQYLSRIPIHKYHIHRQIIGITCNYIAAKVLDYGYSLSDYKKVLDFEHKEVIEAELLIFEVVKNSIDVFTPNLVLVIEKGKKNSKLMLLILLAQYMMPNILKYPVSERVKVCNLLERINTKNSDNESLKEVLAYTKEGLTILNEIKLPQSIQINRDQIRGLLDTYFLNVKQHTEEPILYKPRQFQIDRDISERVIGKMIGSGNYGKVYSVSNTDGLNIIKKFRTKEKDGTINNGLLIELGIIGCTNHTNLPNLVRVTHNYIEMPYYGSPISTCDISKCPDQMKRNYFSQIVSAIHYLNNCRIMHNDIKPDNILLKQNKITVIDFGISSVVSFHPLVQSYAYRAPEVLFNIGSCWETEVWALGCIWYEFVYGRTLCKTNCFGNWETDFVSIFGVPQDEEDRIAIEMRNNMPNPSIHVDILEQRRIRDDNILFETLVLLPSDRMKIGELYNIFKPFMPSEI